MKFILRCLPGLAGSIFSVVFLVACGSDSASVVSGEGDDQTQGENGGENEAGNNQSGETDSGDTGDNNPDGEDPDGADVVTEFEAMYRATFEASWSVNTHPLNFPSDPHFSPLTGAVHSAQAVLWSRGDIASPGIEVMAETGGTSLLLSEIQSVIDEGRALSSVEGGGISTSPGSTSVEFLIDRSNSRITLVSMLAPSPDWFIGVNGLELIGADNEFISGVTVDLRLYDSGTDTGARFDSADEDTVPKSPIDLVSSDASDSNFLNGEPVVGRLIIEKMQ